MNLITKRRTDNGGSSESSRECVCRLGTRVYIDNFSGTLYRRRCLSAPKTAFESVRKSHHDLCFILFNNYFIGLQLAEGNNTDHFLGHQNVEGERNKKGDKGKVKQPEAEIGAESCNTGK